MHKYTVLKLPIFLRKYRNNKEIVNVDNEIIDVIKHLWKNKIETLGCCQGDKNPSLVIPEMYSDYDIDKIDKLILEVDNRKWDILQWRNIKVNVKNKPKSIGINKKDILK